VIFTTYAKETRKSVSSTRKLYHESALMSMFLITQPNLSATGPDYRLIETECVIMSSPSSVYYSIREETMVLISEHSIKNKEGT
jgi:hypothetical protein